MATKAKTRTRQGSPTSSPESSLAANAPARNEAALTPQQERFVAEYLIDLNGKQAAIRAGYAPRSAEVQASRLLSIAKVREAVAAAQAKRSERVEITADRVLRELGRLAFFDPRRMYRDDGTPLDVTELPDDVAACIGGIDIVIERTGESAHEVSTVRKYKVTDKFGPLKLLGQHVGLFKRQLELTGKGGGPVQVEELGPDLSKLTREERAQYSDLVRKLIGSTEGATGGT